VALKAANTIRGNAKVMRERQRVEILRDRLSAHGFLSIPAPIAAMAVDSESDARARA